jgi:hypothetical protein
MLDKLRSSAAQLSTLLETSNQVQEEEDQRGHPRRCAILRSCHTGRYAIESLALEPIVRREKPIANQPIERA